MSRRMKASGEGFIRPGRLSPSSLSPRRLRAGRRARADDRLGEALHLFELRAALEQEQPDARGLELGDPLGHAFGRAYQAGAQAAVRDRVVFERDALFELRVGEPLLVVAVAGGGLLHVRDAL